MRSLQPPEILRAQRPSDRRPNCGQQWRAPDVATLVAPPPPGVHVKIVLGADVERFTYDNVAVISGNFPRCKLLNG